jgi:hypothetical protein
LNQIFFIDGTGSFSTKSFRQEVSTFFQLQFDHTRSVLDKHICSKANSARIVEECQVLLDTFNNYLGDNITIVELCLKTGFLKSISKLFETYLQLVSAQSSTGADS